ncbi:hypothetical protein BDM02DRAFT_980375 [Thelephora ganbajun]|uniref:Uncharacterized protein n=1 Tax=Thelephora ganbajun TaxID=370292 RepID=A0ACB6ZPA6_THEGA|nr:hypothetical protein BDM02DRAFT_980375 [Thelephora ganbajun]
MVTHGCPSWLSVFTAISFSLPVWSVISTSTPTPPLQWLNITRLLSGPSAPPLKGASIGYDETTRTLLVFGGESESGFPTSTTYLLNLDSLIWTVPTPPTGLDGAPPPRSSAISGFDWAANQRQCHIVIGGRGTDGDGLSDVWEYDFLTQFWAPVSLSPGGPSGRWGAAGGKDHRVDYLPTSGLNNSFYLAGGQDKNSISHLSDVWRLNVSGTLSPNNPQQVFGSWEAISIPTLPPVQGPAGTVILQQIISSGGCKATTPLNSDNACAVGDSFIINTSSRSSISPASCPAPRYEGIMVANMNGASSSFNSQAFLLLGTFNSSLWDDAGGLSKGEIAVLDTSTGSWSRILPAGDPSSVSPYPSPRSGAAAVAHPEALIGRPRTGASDTIVFGGQDADGKYLSEVWLLRAYNGVITRSGDQSWGGFGNGQLQSGPNANGAGVTNAYMVTCATQISPDVPPPSSTTLNIPSPTSSGSPNIAIAHPYDVSTIHKILAPLSVALALPMILVHRLSSPSLKSPLESSPNPLLVFILLIPGSLIFGLGIAGLVTAFTSISYDPPLVRRVMLSLHLQTGHGIAGVALAAAFYIAIPIVFLFSLFIRHRSEERNSLSQDEAEKLAPRSPVPSTLILDGTLDHQASPNHSRSQSSTGLLHFWKRSMDRSRSSDTDGDDFGVRDPPSPRPSRGFEVVNRPKNDQRASSHGMSGFVDHSRGRAGAHTAIRLGEMSWLNRRRMVNTVGDLDYALTQIPRTTGPTTNTADVLFNRESMTSARSFPVSPVSYPPPLEVAFHTIFHALLLALCALCLVQLWQRAPVTAFAVFLAWIAGSYIALVVLSWQGRPRNSILTVTLSRLRARLYPHQTNPPPQPDSRPVSSATPEPSIPLTPDPRSPYLHSPPFRTAQEDESYDLMSAGRHRNNGDEDPDDDEDEETRQRRMEDEMNRRDVSIVTVPKRKLWIANPS